MIQGLLFTAVDSRYGVGGPRGERAATGQDRADRQRQDLGRPWGGYRPLRVDGLRKYLSWDR